MLLLLLLFFLLVVGVLAVSTVATFRVCPVVATVIVHFILFQIILKDYLCFVQQNQSLNTHLYTKKPSTLPFSSPGP